MHTLFIIGKRKSGKSTTISQKIGEGANTLIYVETEHDYNHHKLQSPKALLRMREEECDFQIEDADTSTSIQTIVLDNVIFYPDDPLFWHYYNNNDNHTIKNFIVSMSHPISLPLSIMKYEVIPLSHYIAGMEKRLNHYISSQSISSLSMCSNVSL
jgi:predicted AAA+ superfamily ATPase